MSGGDDASVHLHLRGRLDEDALAALRLHGARPQVRQTLRTYQLHLLLDPLTPTASTSGARAARGPARVRS